MNQINKSRLFSAGLIAAFGGGMGLGSLSEKGVAPARDKCAGCGCQIHPGKPGRKCKPCREAKQEAIQIHDGNERLIVVAHRDGTYGLSEALAKILVENAESKNASEQVVELDDNPKHAG